VSVTVISTFVMTMMIIISYPKLKWPELTCSKSTRLNDAFIGHARQRHDLTRCSETRTVSAQSVMHEHMHSSATVHTGVRELEFRSVQFLCCEQASKVLELPPSLCHTYKAHSCTPSTHQYNVMVQRTAVDVDITPWRLYDNRSEVNETISWRVQARLWISM